MSHLFDALQRSEAERSGSDLSALATATEVLQLAERHAVLEKGTTVCDKPYVAKPAEHDTLPSQRAMPSAATADETHVAVETSPDLNRLNPFFQFKSLQVVVPVKNRLACFTDSDSVAAENFRFLGVRLQHLRKDRPLKKVLITSTIPQEGKSTVAANLACTLARKAQQKILLVEGDVRRPSLSQMFGLGKKQGICEWLFGEGDLISSIYHLEGPNLWILPAGSSPENPLELLQSGTLPAIMSQVAELFDWVIIDSPPILPLADTSVWMRLADGILLVARQGTTEKRQLQRGLEALEPKKLIGALLNVSKNAARNDYYYYRSPSAPLLDGAR
jgi:capsular exopolysaccharide synthesis family protein